MSTIYHNTALTTVECCKCGGALGLNATWVSNARSVGNQKHQFWCPYCGTTQGWGGKSEAEKLKEEIERWKASHDRLTRGKADALAEAEHFRRSRDGMKGVVAKIKKRVGTMTGQARKEWLGASDVPEALENCTTILNSQPKHPAYRSAVQDYCKRKGIEGIESIMKPSNILIPIPLKPRPIVMEKKSMTMKADE